MVGTIAKRYINTLCLIPMPNFFKEFFFIACFLTENIHRRVLPLHPEKQLILNANRILWQLVDIQHITGRNKPRATWIYAFHIMWFILLKKNFFFILFDHKVTWPFLHVTHVSRICTSVHVKHFRILHFKQLDTSIMDEYCTIIGKYWKYCIYSIYFEWPPMIAWSTTKHINNAVISNFNVTIAINIFIAVACKTNKFILKIVALN